MPYVRFNELSNLELRIKTPQETAVGTLTIDQSRKTTLDTPEKILFSSQQTLFLQIPFQQTLYKIPSGKKYSDLLPRVEGQTVGKSSAESEDYSQI